MASGSILEVVLFKAKAGVSEAAIDEMVLKIQPVVESFPGYIAREVFKGADGLWMDVVRWNSLAEAKAAADEVIKMPEMAQAFSVLDEKTMQFYHLERVVQFPNGE